MQDNNEVQIEEIPSAAGTTAGGLPGSGGGQGSTGDLSGPGEKDTLAEMKGDVPQAAADENNALTENTP